MFEIINGDGANGRGGANGGDGKQLVKRKNNWFKVYSVRKNFIWDITKKEYE